MPAVYRIEVSPNNRAGCVNVECKNAGVKILKGELRHATLVEINEHQSWKYKHWGCVTPLQFGSWNEVTESNLELVDGLEELPQDLQDKVVRAIQQGHVDDEDWKGDVEKNREGQKGMRLPKPKKAKKDDETTAEEANASAANGQGPKKQATKRAQPSGGGDEVDEKPARKKKKKNADQTEEADGGEAEERKSRKKRAATAAKQETVDETDPLQKMKRSKKTKTAAEEDDRNPSSKTSETIKQNIKEEAAEFSRENPRTSRTKASAPGNEDAADPTESLENKAKSVGRKKNHRINAEAKGDNADGYTDTTVLKPKARRGRPRKSS